MGWVDEYKKKLVSAEEAVKVVKSGDWLDYGQFAAQVVALDKALAARKNDLWDVKIRSSTRTVGRAEVVQADPSAEHFCYNSHFLSRYDRQAHDQGLCWYIPIFYHENPLCYRDFLDVDVAMIATTPMDEHGFFNFSTSVSYSRAICDKAKIVILEANPNLPTCLGGRGENIHLSEVDYIVEADWPVPEIHPAIPTKVDKKIAAFIMQEIKDGACLQLGIGGLPNVVGAMLAQSDLKDLGIHSEMFNDAMVELVEAGRVTGARKNIDRYKNVFTFSLGTRKTYDFLHNNKMCAAYSVDYTNDPYIMAQNDKMVAINNCVAIDLFGQVCSESAGPRQISGTGGQADFMFGVNRSKGGKAFICMSSTRTGKDGRVISRITPVLSPGSIVTAPRNLVSYVVTEYGLVNLRGKSTWERAADLISIAHPDFREGLIKEAEKLKIWRRSNKIR
jgi:butyryl-CoA:acetate CoA-transferase